MVSGMVNYVLAASDCSAVEHGPRAAQVYLIKDFETLKESTRLIL